MRVENQKIIESLVKDPRSDMFIIYYLYLYFINYIDAENRHDISKLSNDRDIIYIMCLCNRLSNKARLYKIQ
jgi:hypothetical protein